HGVAAQARIEDANAPDSFEGHEGQGDGEDRSCKDQDDAGGVHGPEEERHAEPGEAFGAHFLDSDNEIQAGENGTEAGDKNAGRHPDDMSVGVSAAVRGVEGPASVNAANDDGVHDEGAASHEEVPA